MNHSGSDQRSSCWCSWVVCIRRSVIVSNRRTVYQSVTLLSVCPFIHCTYSNSGAPKETSDMAKSQRIPKKSLQKQEFSTPHSLCVSHYVLFLSLCLTHNHKGSELQQRCIFTCSFQDKIKASVSRCKLRVRRVSCTGQWRKRERAGC